MAETEALLNTPNEEAMNNDESGWNFIVIGGGASGCALASVLETKGSTLLIERGKENTAIPESQTVSGWPKILTTEAAENVETEEGVWNIAPKILGGGTSLNVGVWVRETQDYFEALNVKIPYNKALESYERLEGKLVVTNRETEFAKAYKEALIREGHYEDGGLSYNRENEKANLTYSIFTNENEADKRVRRPSASLLDKGNPNLTLLTRHRVNRILFDESVQPPKAIGVEVLDLTFPLARPHRMLLAPDGQLFVCAGAIYSPHLLMLSGVGPAEHLQSKNVKVVANNPGVGENFKDKPVNPIDVFTKDDLPQVMVETIANSNARGSAYACTSGGNIISTIAPVAIALFPPGHRHAILRPIIKVAFAILPSVGKFIDKAYQLIAFTSEPKSKGYVRLRNNDPGHSPEVAANYYKEKEDLDGQVNRVRLLHKMINGPELKKFALGKDETCEIIKLINFYMRETYDLHSETNTELRADDAHHHLVDPVFPDDEVISYPPFPADMSDDEAVKKWILDTYVCSYHNGGSTSQAVDENFNLKGVQGVKVVDASVLEKLPRTHMQATLMMLGDFVGQSIQIPTPSTPRRHVRELAMESVEPQGTNETQTGTQTQKQEEHMVPDNRE